MHQGEWIKNKLKTEMGKTQTTVARELEIGGGQSSVSQYYAMARLPISFIQSVERVYGIKIPPYGPLINSLPSIGSIESIKKIILDNEDKIDPQISPSTLSDPITPYGHSSLDELDSLKKFTEVAANLADLRDRGVISDVVYDREMKMLHELRGHGYEGGRE